MYVKNSIVQSHDSNQFHCENMSHNLNYRLVNSGNSHVVDYTSLQNLVSDSERRLQLNTWYLSKWLPHLIHAHSGPGSIYVTYLHQPISLSTMSVRKTSSAPFVQSVKRVITIPHHSTPPHKPKNCN
jgi:hypothetical protein